MKKWIAGLVILALLIPGAVFAEDTDGVLTPDAEVYDTVRLIEEAAYTLTEDPEDKALLQDGYAENRLTEAEALLGQEGSEDLVEGLIADYEESVTLVGENLEQVRLNGADVEVIEAYVAEKFADRTARMNELLAREDLNEHAKAGIAKAIENQAKAMENFVQAKLQAGQGQAKQEDKVTGQERAAQAQAAKPENPGKGKGK